MSKEIFFYLLHFLEPAYLLRIDAIFIPLDVMTVNVLSSL